MLRNHNAISRLQIQSAFEAFASQRTSWRALENGTERVATEDEEGIIGKRKLGPWLRNISHRGGKDDVRTARSDRMMLQ